MTIAELIRDLPVELVRGSGRSDVSEIVEDSRCASTGCLFVARAGTTLDGRAFIAEAVAGGAVAVLTDQPASVGPPVVVLACADVPLAAALLAERFCGRPSEALTLVGITGTNGKTTTAHLVHQILNRGGVRCGLVGTVRIDDGAVVTAASLTTPPAIELSRALRAMVDSGCTCAVVEASSHALDQKRTAGLRFDGAVFTNLSGDHLDYHRTFDAYAEAKAILFESIGPEGWAVVNADDPVSERMSRRCRGRVVTCGLRARDAECRAEVVRETAGGCEVVFGGPWGRLEVALPLIGRHNVANALQAAAVCHLLGLDRSALAAGLSRCAAPPGRLEPVSGADHEFSVLVDYAHTDDALENVLRALRPLVGGAGRLRVVFGCGGDRDRSKRPRMAAVAWRYADEVIITSDNPRTEDPQRIVDEVVAGVPRERRGETTCLLDRREAIDRAIERARPGDVVLIAGKGHEDYQIIGTVKRPFDDRRVAAAAVVRHSGGNRVEAAVW